jgi:hypothetical protein
MDASPEDGFELFRRAIVDREQAAWEAIHTRYRILLISWARQSSVSAMVDEQLDDIADQAFARAWSALTPQRFQAFPSLATILGYLRNCVGAVLIDKARAQATRERTIQQLGVREAPTPEDLVIEELDRTSIWRLVSEVVETPQEEIIIRENILLEIPPRQILARWPDRFRSIGEVYASKRNLIGRLQRNSQIQQLYREIREAA